MELATEAFQRKDFEAAADAFGDLRMSYADSPHQFNAHFLGLKAVMETYQGPDYNEGPLIEAEKLIKTMTRQFPPSPMKNAITSVAPTPKSDTRKRNDFGC